MFGNCHNSHTLLKRRARSLLITQVLLHSTGVLNLAEFKELNSLLVWNIHGFTRFSWTFKMLFHFTKAKPPADTERFRWGHLCRGKSAKMSAGRVALDIFYGYEKQAIVKCQTWRELKLPAQLSWWPGEHPSLVMAATWCCRSS